MSWNKCLKYFKSGEYQVVCERLNDLRKAGKTVCPARKDMFNALKLTPPDKVKVAIIGQDPYPNPVHATGVAFSIPADIQAYPPSLVNLFTVYSSDLNLPRPATGDLTKWCSEGVLLWNATPSCTAHEPGSHNWVEWDLLSQEIVEYLDGIGKTVFILLGRRAGTLNRHIRVCPVICTSHPSPLGARHGFLESKIFTRSNDLLVQLGQSPIDWRLHVHEEERNPKA